MEDLVDAIFHGGTGRRIEEEKDRMERERKRHEETLERKDALKQEELAWLHNKEEMIRAEQKLEKEEAAEIDKKLREIRERKSAEHAEQYKSISEDNKNRLEKLAESNEEALKNERIRERDEKQRLVERNVDESIRVEQRQKEIEANLGEIAKDAEEEKRKQNELKMSEGQQYSKQLDEVKSKQFDELKELNEEQHQAALKGAENKVYYEARAEALRMIRAQGETKLAEALNNATHTGNSTSVVQAIKIGSGDLSSISTKLTSQISVSVRSGTPTRFVIRLIKELVQKFKMGMDRILQGIASSGFGIKDGLHEDRKSLGEKVLKTLESLTRIIEEWHVYLYNGTSDDDVIEAMGSNLSNFETLVKTLNDQASAIPLPQAGHNDVGSIVAENCAAIANGSLLDGAALQALQLGSFSGAQMPIGN